jgi:hypothetical protein
MSEVPPSSRSLQVAHPSLLLALVGTVLPLDKAFPLLVRVFAPSILTRARPVPRNRLRSSENCSSQTPGRSTSQIIALRRSVPIGMTGLRRSEHPHSTPKAGFEWAHPPLKVANVWASLGVVAQIRDMGAKGKRAYAIAKALDSEAHARDTAANSRRRPCGAS